MLRDAVRGVAVVAAELAEETGKRVVGAATGLLERSGVDVASIERTVKEQFPPSAKSLQTLAGEAVTAGRAGIDLAVGVARSEVEALFEKVGDQVVKAGVILGYLESKLREVEETQAPKAPEPRAEGLFDAGWEDEAEMILSPEEPVVAEKPVVRREPVVVEEPVKKPAAKKAPARKAADTKAPVEKAVAKKAVAKKAAVKKTAVKKAAVKKTTAKKAAPAKKTTARKKATDE